MGSPGSRPQKFIGRLTQANHLHTDNDRKRWGWLRAIAASLIIVLVAALWYECFHQYIDHNDYRGDIFRYTYHQAVAPFYMWKYPWSARNMPALICAVLVSAYLIFFYSRLSDHKLALVFPVLAWLGLSMLFAFSEADARVLGSYAHFQTFANDLHFFNSPSELLRNYVQLQPSMDVHGQHYPPGYVWLLFVFGIAGTHILCYVAGMVSILLLYRIAIRMHFSRSTALLAASLLSLAPGFLIYPGLDPVVLFICVTLAAFYCFQRLTQQPAWVYAIGFGACVFAGSMFSYAFFMWGLLPVLWLLWPGQKRSMQVFKYLALAISVFVLLHLLLWLSSGFNMVACFQGSLQRDRAINTLNPFDDGIRYLFRVSSILLGFALSAGMAWSFSGYIKNRMGKMVLLGIVLIACSGLLFGEAERILLFFIPYAMLASAEQIEAAGLQQRWILLLCLVFSVWLEFQFCHYA